MDILFVSGRDPALLERGGADLSARECAERLAREGAALGHHARHLASLRVGSSRAHVTARVVDAELEVELAREVRARFPDLVHVLAFGGDASAQAPWIAARLGATVVVSASAARTLCHRGDLVHREGERCEEFSDAVRCALCTERGRRVADEFATRHELVMGGLLAADLVLVPQERDRRLLAAAGVPGRLLRVAPEPLTFAWLAEVYATVHHAE